MAKPTVIVKSNATQSLEGGLAGEVLRRWYNLTARLRENKNSDGNVSDLFWYPSSTQDFLGGTYKLGLYNQPTAKTQSSIIATGGGSKTLRSTLELRKSNISQIGLANLRYKKLVDGTIPNGEINPSALTSAKTAYDKDNDVYLTVFSSTGIKGYVWFYNADGTVNKGAVQDLGDTPCWNPKIRYIGGGKFLLMNRGTSSRCRARIIGTLDRTNKTLGATNGAWINFGATTAYGFDGIYEPTQGKLFFCSNHNTYNSQQVGTFDATTLDITLGSYLNQSGGGNPNTACSGITLCWDKLNSQLVVMANGSSTVNHGVRAYNVSGTTLTYSHYLQMSGAAQGMPRYNQCTLRYSDAYDRIICATWGGGTSYYSRCFPIENTGTGFNDRSNTGGWYILFNTYQQSFDMDLKPDDSSGTDQICIVAESASGQSHIRTMNIYDNSGVKITEGGTETLSTFEGRNPDVQWDPDRNIFHVEFSNDTAAKYEGIKVEYGGDKWIQQLAGVTEVVTVNGTTIPGGIAEIESGGLDIGAKKVNIEVAITNNSSNNIRAGFGISGGTYTAPTYAEPSMSIII